MDVLEQIARCVEESDFRSITDAIHAAWDEGVSNERILNEGLLKGLDTLSQNFENSQVFIADLLMASKVFGRGAEMVYESEQVDTARSKGRVLLATTAGDIHDIGKNIIRSVMESAGFEVIDLGVDVRPSEISNAVVEHEPDIVALSATLTSALFTQKDTIDLLCEQGLRDKVKVVVGGAATLKIDNVDEMVGADASSHDATDIVPVIESVLR